MIGTIQRPLEILLVEDNPAYVRLTQEALKKTEVVCNMNVAEDGEVALAVLRGEGEYANASRPDLVLLDLNLPKKDGREVLAEVKLDDDLRLIPIVVLSTSQDDEDLTYSYGMYANSYVIKPVDMSRLNDVLRGMIDYWVNISTLPKT